MKILFHCLNVCLFFRVTCAFAENFTNELDLGFAADKQQKFDQSIAHYSKALQMDGNSSESYLAYLCRGNAYLRTKQLKNARNDFDEAVRTTTTLEDSAKAYYVRGLARLTTFSNQLGALSDFSMAIKFNSTLQDAYICRAQINLSQGRYDDVIEDCEAATIIKPDEARAFYYKGLAHRFKKNAPGAILAYTIAIRLDTNLANYAEIYLDRGRAYFSTGQITNALNDLTRAVQIAPTNAQAFSARGFVLSRMGNFSSGIADCEQGIRLDDNRVEAYNNLAWLLATAPQAKLRNGNDALKYAMRACNLSGWTDANCLGTLAAAYAETGKFDEAIKWEQKCIELGLDTEKEMLQARKELELFKQKKPYHAEK